MKKDEFYTIKRLPPYVFAKVNSMKAKLRADSEDVIDFGMGNPDQPTPQHIVDKLCEAVKNPRTHRYSVSKGILGLRKALSGYYERRFDVKLNPEDEVIVTLGSKEGLASLAKAIVAPGDTVLVPNPSYPIHAFGVLIAGGVARKIPIEPDENFFKVAEDAVKYSIPKPIALIVSYPSNPTARIASLDFYKELVAFCKKHELFIISDIAYSEIYYNDVPPPSVLQVEGAKDIAVEFYSLSKTYSMPGWRVGFGSGNKDLIAALGRVKSYLDYGAFAPIQIAATEALNGPQDCVVETRLMYKERRDVLVKGLNEIGWNVEMPEASMFAWANIPKEFIDAGMNSVSFASKLLEHCNVAVSPGGGFGEDGDSSVRFAFIENVLRTRQALKNMKKFFKDKDKIIQGFKEEQGKLK
ncbi:MAG: Glutamate-pyruvate aminotransferase AlaC [Alphaproteobacteria bacterium ADurb.Bin438]|nr:MAG: Glutamate-pyruvate aminotransferase AlaC [Alphaproteobacteria bacterium ADurb.Bin438]